MPSTKPKPILSVLSAIHAPALFFSTSWNVLYFNAAAKALPTFRRLEVGIAFAELHPPVLDPLIFQRLRSLLKAGETVNLPDLWGRSATVYPADGGVVIMCSTSLSALSATALSESRPPFARSYEEYRDLFNQAKIGLCLDVEEGNTIGRINEAFARLHGYALEELEGQPVEMLFPPHLRSQVSEIAKIVDSRDHTSFETIHARKDGSIFPVLVEATVVRDETGKFRYRIVNVKDISDLKEAEAKLHRLNEELERRVIERTEALKWSQESLRRSERLASIGTLAAGIAHEINNPLNSILLAAQYGLRTFADHPMMGRILKDIECQTLRCGKITKGILQFAREEKTRKETSDLRMAVSQGCQLAKTYVQSPINLSLTLPEDSVPVLMNTVNIEQVLVNLVQNAAQASPKGVDVSVRLSVESRTARLLIHDSGPGIPDEVVHRIFDPFFTTRTGKGGSGLGLSLVHSVVLDHEGTIEVQSEKGKGTTFVIHLPIQSLATEL